MYNPPKFKSDDLDAAFELMNKYPFATVITASRGCPYVSHLPITPKKVGERIELIGHIARANPQWKSFASAPLTIIFHGPHTYISPKWYAENNVPTWNYSAAHASGTAELIEDPEGILSCLRELTMQVEQLWPSGWEFFVPKDLSGDTLSKSIVGFRMVVENLNFKMKLSQNRTSEDRAGVLQGLASRADDNSRSVLNDMKKLYTDSGELR